MPIEDFTTYTGKDANNRFTVTPARIDFVGLQWQDYDHYSYKDFGVGHFQDFEWEFEWQTTEQTGGGLVAGPSLGNVIGSIKAQSDYIYFNAYSEYLRITDGLSGEVRGYWGLLGKLYYIVFSRIGTTLTLKIYEDKPKTNLLSTLSIPSCSVTPFGILYPINSYGSAGTSSTTGFLQNLNLEVVECPYPIVNFSHSGGTCI